MGKHEKRFGRFEVGLGCESSFFRLMPSTQEDGSAIMEMEWIRQRISRGEYVFSKHGDQERQNDNLTISEIKEALLSGGILEQYDDTGRGESCLVAGFAAEEKPIHAVCGQRGGSLVIITIYIPGPPKFKLPSERGER